MDLDDPSKTCIYIPPGLPDEDVTTEDEDDLGYDLRMKAYKAAWMKCLDRVRSILQALNAPVVKRVVEHIQTAHDDSLPGLPYPELPVVSLCGANSALLGDVAERLADPSNDESFNHEVLQIHLYPAESSSVTSMMRAIVTGFVDRKGGRKRKPGSLANFDIALLGSWYTAQERQPRLAIFLHEFEKFDVNVVRDVLYICSLHVPQLPLTFIILMVSPATPSFLHTAYPRATLALLRIHQMAVSTGLKTVHEVLTKVFFDPDFEPDVMLGPGALDYMTNFAVREIASPDALMTMLQLAHLKQSVHPLSIFAHDNLLGTASLHDAEETLASPACAQLTEALHARLLALTPNDVKEPPQNAHDLLTCVTSCRATFQSRVRRMRIAFAIARIAERVSLGDAAATPSSGRSADGRSSRLDSLETLSAVLRGRAGSQVRYVCMAVRKLSAAKLNTLLQELHSFLFSLNSANIRREEQDARVWIVETMNQLPEDSGEAAIDDAPVVQDASTKQLAAEVGDWLQEYIEERFTRLEDCPLWDIWYTGSSPFPSELVNPAPRPTVVAALLHPFDFIRSHADLARSYAPKGNDDVSMFSVPEEPELWELPDTSIAFRRYVEAGRMVNVFDWFESFAVVLESQWKHLKRRAELATRTKTNGKAKGKGKAKASAGKKRHQDEDDVGSGSDDDIEMDEEEEEKWKVEVQARFIRALHELDHMGFVKHTGRKPDHVIRTTFDVPD